MIPYALLNLGQFSNAIVESVWRNGWGPQSGETLICVGEGSLVCVCEQGGVYTCIGHMAARQSFVRLDQ